MKRVAALFQSCLGGIFLAVFLSLSAQLVTLVGSRGLLPVRALLESVPSPGSAQILGFPTLLWLESSDAAIQSLTWGGAALSVLLLLRLATRAVTLGLWALFLSCVVAGQDFFQYQWDNLLLEAALLAALLPGGGGPRGLFRPERLREPPAALIFLFRWLLFRLLFESGWAKVVGGEASWWDLSAMSYYYETAPLPSWGGWLVQQAPLWFHQASALFTFLVELPLATLAFLPRRFRLVLFAANAPFQASIFLTSNYGYFNALSLALSLFLLDDRDVERVGRWLRQGAEALRCGLARLRLRGRLVSRPGAEWDAPRAGPGGAEALHMVPQAAALPAPGIAARAGWGALAALMVAASLLEAAFFFAPRALPGSAPSLRALAPLRFYAPLRLVNVYHLFPGVLRERIVIEVNGSIDGVAWSPYRFRYTPGDPRLAPPPTWLHKPRFAFHYSFLPLNRRRDLAYLGNLLQRLCCDPQAVSGLVAVDPFPGGRPRALRLDFYRYRLGDALRLQRTGEYWVREFLGSHRQIFPCRCQDLSSAEAPAPPQP